MLSGTFKDLFDWIVSPDAFIRWIKRYQERQANAAKKPKKKGRPWISLKKVDAILRIYDAGHTGLKRIVGEMNKLKMKVAKSTVRKVLNRNGRAPTDSNRRKGATWWQFWSRHAPYNEERPHQGIGNIPIGPWEAPDEGEIVCDERLGGLLISFHRAA